MARIEIEVPAELAARLERFQDDLPRLLQQGLDALERERAVERQAMPDEAAGVDWHEPMASLRRGRRADLAARNERHRDAGGDAAMSLTVDASVFVERQASQ